MKKLKYEFIGKTLFFPKQGILVVGDLHLGYENMLCSEGYRVPFNQLEDSKKDFEEVVARIGKEKINKVVFLGDIRHSFGFSKEEYFEVRDFMDFIRKLLKGVDLIMIKGNHDTILKKEHKNYYVVDDIVFTHGDKFYFELMNKNINLIVIGHIHPAVIISDETGIKREKYKAFLIGKWNNKNMIVIPSFFSMIEGSEINEEYKDKADFSIVPREELKKFDVYVVGEEDIYKFGKYRDLR